MSRVVYACALAAMVFGISSWASSRAADIVPGVYAIAICEGVCTSVADTAFVSGRVVLLDRTLLDKAGHPKRVEFAGKANGCFELSPLRKQTDSYAGLQKSGYLAWKQSSADGSVQFSLFRSPDAGYEVSVEPTARGFVGTGSSWGGAGEGTATPADAVTLVRLGDVPAGACAHVVED